MSLVWDVPDGPSLPYETIDEAVEDYERSQARLCNAYQELSKLDYSDVVYAPLDEILNKAVVN